MESLLETAIQRCKFLTYRYYIFIDSEGFKTDNEKFGYWHIGTCRCG